jgi:hypothetical protein
MNEHDQSIPPPILSGAPIPAAQPPARDFSWWLRKLFACNPFYLASAALLLFGGYQVSADATFFKTEWAQLLCNFSSLQLYEILLVLAAIFLARRKIWYDSTLLVVLENMLVFVPFILISQAALIDVRGVRVLCVIGATVALLRFSALKKFFAELNLPNRLLAPRLVLLALNVGLPLIYRAFGQTKLGVNIESGPAYAMNEYTWLLILPVAFGLANFVPHVGGTGSLLPQRRWLPAGVFALWIISTTIHVYSLGYVYDFKLRPDLLAPTIWVFAWTICRFAYQLRLLSDRQIRDALIFAPLLIPLFAAPADNATFLILSALNAGIYAGISFRLRDCRIARHLFFISVLMCIAAIPSAWLHSLAPDLNRPKWIAAIALAYLMIHTVLSRNPKLAIVGSLALGSAVMVVFENHNGAMHWAFQCALVFLLVHSLRWHDWEHHGASAVRITMSLGWVTHSFAWMRSDNGEFWMPMISGASVLAIYSLVQLLRGKWSHVMIPIASMVVMLSGLVAPAFEKARSTPSGLVAVIGSFVLFACGTVAALTRHRWHHNGGSSKESPQPKIAGSP